MKQSEGFCGQYVPQEIQSKRERIIMTMTQILILSAIVLYLFGMLWVCVIYSKKN